MRPVQVGDTLMGSFRKRPLAVQAVAVIPPHSGGRVRWRSLDLRLVGWVFYGDWQREYERQKPAGVTG